MSAAAASPSTDPHIPVLLAPLLRAVAPVTGVWVDGTFGAGGYARGLIEAGADKVIGIDRDPLAHEMAASWLPEFEGRIELHRANFAEMDEIAYGVDGVVLDLGVSSMQLDLAERGFSFMKDGPLDMRMGQDGPSAADIVNTADEFDIADILYTYGEERASRRIAKAIVAARKVAPITRTLELTRIVESCLPRPKPGQSHPATRSFQALRIAVNDEYGALMQGLMAAERALKPGGLLAVVSFHSVEDRMVKRFLQARGGQSGRANRYAPEIEAETPAFKIVTRKAVGPDDDELAVNPRSRSAKLRVARRTDAPAGDIDAGQIALPQLKEDR
ncbi:MULTISPECIES: 16S rRNA (cytosine(1402)-N(4))-methyltransferase RsmH [Marivita]|uniref:Ribosomal RNA small subunit methyltransferase H n=1 Tax=Marivita cryptomonadis TaxID=505252 RepID=A0A9Q2S3R9_9RHOB|nr:MULTISPECIES: 16S rRNA (cytosine(1402)-N(4))-methyltransferase RsmH [Marivita]MCR9169673.1 16S rRNA (cytosine(1402)-N(4))-methyltransferase RsmH [Paracoccaceae bacterium]MBM2320419.1 16S rRNA (cytosine(1402)-N(4))-methyltransferase RsmH [Marivita cryptomonadis]MBM2329999.1 16S rRNA (cytosine(1402)-N(4))-methyltransferase RsmH [Marivita cryptomonadis]MBM2339586.1 16S rRNA (cytosine(1402)-N(4))-methyltransferase RsmH [Marivita cryptomonadis]MBM2344245.1 16S rRNA (cytosine(1402)-N(4))-methyltr